MFLLFFLKSELIFNSLFAQFIPLAKSFEDLKSARYPFCLCLIISLTAVSLKATEGSPKQPAAVKTCPKDSNKLGNTNISDE